MNTQECCKKCLSEANPTKGWGAMCMLGSSCECHNTSPIEVKPKHEMYCVKSGMRCAVMHTDGICPDVRDCEACKQESI